MTAAHISSTCDQAYAAEGASVIATDINAELLKQLDSVPNVRTVVLNVLKKEEIDAFAASV